MIPHPYRTLHRAAVAFGLLVALLSLGLAPALAAGAEAGQGTGRGGPPTPSDPAGHISGVVPARPQSGTVTSANNLTYHNRAPVMLTNRAHGIYWFPSSGYPVPAGYASTIDGFFSDVAHDSGLKSNVYYSDTQYYQSNPNGTKSHIAYRSSFVGSTIDTTSAFTNDCPLYTVGTQKLLACVTDAAVQADIQRVLATTGWTPSMTDEFFVLTPPGVGSCFDSSGTSCSYLQWCGYHGSFTYNGATVLYANLPYDAWSSSCSSSQRPNGNDADETINIISHEHNEAITDPLANAWFDSQGQENGDKCVWNFGAVTGGASGAYWNQTINGNHYYVQQEWSNRSAHCVQTGL